MQNDYEELFESIPCGILQLELPFGNTCKIYRVNPRAEQIMKVHLVEGDLMSAEAYLDGDSIKYAREILRKLVNPGDQSHFLLKTHNSAIEGEVRLIRMENGHELLQCMFVEVGEEIEARRREARQKEVLERVLDSINCGVLRYTFEDGEQKITLVNPAGWKLLGFEREDQCLHKTLNDILPQIYPEDQIHVLTAHCSINKENDRRECEFRVADEEGGCRKLHALLQCLRSADGSQVLQVTLTDITLQYQIIEQKKQENEQIIHSLGSVYLTILQVDVCNDTYRVIKDEIHGDMMKPQGNYSQILGGWNRIRTSRKVPDDAVDLSLDFFRKLYAKGKTSWEQDYSHYVPEENTQRYFRVVLLLTGEEELSYVTMAIRDITEIHKRELDEKEALRAACEASRQASRAKTDFLSNMSHDIRTPMNAIAGFTQILERHLDSPEILAENIEKIKKSSQILLDLINEVLDVSRIESGKVILDEQPVLLTELAEETADLIRPSITKHGHHLVTEFNLPDGTFLGDALRIRQILMNLLSNAVKFTPDGGEIKFLAWEDEENESTKYRNIHFQIQDNGFGMTQEFQQHIFEPFERAPETESLQGTGLGMTITRNLIRLMNGMIQFTSEQGKGTCFHVIIPMKASDPVEKQKEEELIDDAAPDWSKRRILVVEDNELNMEITCTFLEETGVSFETAMNGKEALDKFEASPQGYYDLILMDVQMPVMNGYEATRRIRSSSHPDASRIPVIAMTANAFSEDIYAARQAGMNEHLSKPIEIAKMYSVLKNWLSEENVREEEK